MKKIFLISMLFSVFAVTNTYAQFAGGAGTISDPYIINSVAHMQAMHNADYTNPVYYRLTADIDMSGVNWMPINNLSPFDRTLHFDGNGHVIRNLTVIGAGYASLFGVLCGSCKNLGIINADIQSTSGGGIIAGYLGIKTPTSARLTGIVENCYTTGIVSGTDAVGGVIGNVGKPFESTKSIIRNCYSTATVISNNISGNSRAGGIAGIIFEEGILENSYATGTVISSAAGAGGIVGWTDKSLKGVVALNDSVINTVAGNIGRISAFMGRVNNVIAQGAKCWAYNGMVVKNGDYILVESDFVKGEVTERNTPFDGITQSATFLSDPMNYFMELGWDFASDNNVWAQTMSNGKPIFQWLFNRGDYARIDGHSSTTSVDETFSNTAKVFIIKGQLHIQSQVPVDAMRVYNASGQLIHKDMHVNSTSIVLELKNKGINIVSVFSDGKWSTMKLIN